jgi:hypothetical protein
LEVTRGRINFTNAVTDDAVCVVIEVRAGRRDAVDQAPLDQWNEARLVEPSGRHRAAERQEDRAALIDAAPHELVSCALLAANVRWKALRQDLMR